MVVGTARRALARAHTEERNLSLTRILNGCAEARTVGTHYSTTHPPPLSQNSTSSYCSFSFSFSSLCLRRSHASLFLSPSHPGPPCSHFSVAGSSDSHHLRSLSRPLSLSLSAPRRNCIRIYRGHMLVALVCILVCALTRTYIYVRAWNTLVYSILFSFQLSFHPTSFLRRSFSSSSSFLREA